MSHVTQIFTFLHSPLDFFPETLGEASDEQDEHCQHDIKSTEHRLSRFLERHYDAILLQDDVL